MAVHFRKYKFNLLSGLLLFLFLKSAGQVTAIDTSDYLPYVYKDALEFNLMIAASRGYNFEVRKMLLKGADIETETEEGATPLIIAVSAGHLDVVKTLLAYGADPDKITNDGMSSLLISAKNNNVDMAEVLIRYGADINITDKNQATALHYASIYGYFYMVDMLLYYNADVNLKAVDGTTPLMAAIWAGYPDISDLLIQHGASIEARDNIGFTPLLIAAQNGDTLLVDLLIRNGADIHERNNFNWNALDLAIKSNSRDLVDILLKKGLTDNHSSVSPYEIAAKYRRKEIIDDLRKRNFPGNYKPGIDEASISISSKFTTRDLYSGFSVSFKEPMSDMGFSLGFDTKLWYTRVLQEKQTDVYYQYLDKSSIVSAGLFRDFPLTDNLFRSNFILTASFGVGYSFGNKFKGTDIMPDNKFRSIPSVSIKWVKKNFIIYSGLELTNTDLYKIGPVWGRFGCAFRFYFDSVRTPDKIIRWY